MSKEPLEYNRRYDVTVDFGDYRLPCPVVFRNVTFKGVEEPTPTEPGWSDERELYVVIEIPGEEGQRGINFKKSTFVLLGES